MRLCGCRVLGFWGLEVEFDKMSDLYSHGKMPCLHLSDKMSRLQLVSFSNGQSK